MPSPSDVPGSQGPSANGTGSCGPTGLERWGKDKDFPLETGLGVTYRFQALMEMKLHSLTLTTHHPALPHLSLYPPSSTARTFVKHRAGQTLSFNILPEIASGQVQLQPDQYGGACSSQQGLTFFPFPSRKACMGGLAVPHPKPQPITVEVPGTTRSLPASPCWLLLLGPNTPPTQTLPGPPRPLLPDLALAAPACCGATDVILLVTIPISVFLLLQPLEQQLMGEASQRGSRRSCRLHLTLQVDVTG